MPALLPARFGPVAAVLLAATALSGCLSGGPGGPEACSEPCTSTGPGTMPRGGLAGVASVAAPSPWRVGDWWNYTIAIGANRTSFTLVVTGEQGGDWVVGTDNAGTAFRNLLEDISYLGPVRKADLAGSQGDARVEYFHWPLAANATWGTTWDGVPVQVATHGPEPCPLGGFCEDPTHFESGPFRTGDMRMTASLPNGTLYASYVYDAGDGWFAWMRFHSIRGLPDFGFYLDRHGHDYAGNIATWRADKVVDWSGPWSGGPQGANWPVPANATDVYASWAFDCTTGAVSAAVGALVVFDNVRGHTSQGACPIADHGAGSLGSPQPPPAGPETWGASLSGTPATDGQYVLQVWVRYLHRVPFGG